MKANHLIAIIGLLFATGLSGQALEDSMPTQAATLAKQFKMFEQTTRQTAEKSISDARTKLQSLLAAEVQKAETSGRPGDALFIRRYMESQNLAQKAADAPDSLAYWDQTKYEVGYFKNGLTSTVNVELQGKKRMLVVYGNQDKEDTNGEILLVRGQNETKVGEWKKGQAGPLQIDVSGSVTKPGPYVFKFKWTVGKATFKVEKVGIQIAMK